MASSASGKARSHDGIPPVVVTAVPSPRYRCIFRRFSARARAVKGCAATIRAVSLVPWTTREKTHRIDTAAPLIRPVARGEGDGGGGWRREGPRNDIHDMPIPHERPENTMLRPPPLSSCVFPFPLAPLARSREVDFLIRFAGVFMSQETKWQVHGGRSFARFTWIRFVRACNGLGFRCCRRRGDLSIAAAESSGLSPLRTRAYPVSHATVIHFR
jgi:hypothetical protein